MLALLSFRKLTPTVVIISCQIKYFLEIEDVPAPDFLPGFVFGCVIMAGLTGIIVGLCLRIETIRR